MTPKSILIVDDEENILELVELHLRKEGYTVYKASTGEEALGVLRIHRVDLIVLDLMLPGMDGLEVCRRIKKNDELMSVPVLMLSARSEETDIVVGLELGADDYVTKPFLPRVLMARVRALLRRSRHQPLPVSQYNLSYDGIEMDLQKHQVMLDGEDLELTVTEFSLLKLFLSHPGWVFTRNQIIQKVKGDDYPVTDRSVDVQVVGLRRKLGRFGEHIETVRGVGYRIRELS